MLFRIIVITLLLAPFGYSQSVCQTCGQVHGVQVPPVSVAADGYPAVYRADERAYQHALREAQILASRNVVGHPLGCAPGTTGSGTGTSWNPSRPNHCFFRSGRRLVARAMVQGRSGKCFWSAHYR